MNSFGSLIRLTTFGESHGPAMGGILDGMPPRVHIDKDAILNMLSRRRGGSIKGTTPRAEADIPEFLSGLSTDNLTLGSPIGFIIRNSDVRSGDYHHNHDAFRPNHADYTYLKKYGIHDFNGGGRMSARDTVSWCVGGAICMQWLEKCGIKINAEFVETKSVSEALAAGDSVGGIVNGEISGLPVGLGEPVFDKFHARLAHAMMSINAAKGFEYGLGYDSAYSSGKATADRFRNKGSIPTFDSHSIPELICTSNNSGGVQGGITNGMPVTFRVYFKPTPTPGGAGDSIDIYGNHVEIQNHGRHDACVAIRAAVVVEAMAALVTADMLRLAMSYPD